MPSILAPLDQWTDLASDGSLRIFPRTDALTPDDWQVRIDWGITTDGLLEIRCLNHLPAGFRLQVAFGPTRPQPVDDFEQMNTTEFRAAREPRPHRRGNP